MAALREERDVSEAFEKSPHAESAAAEPVATSDLAATSESQAETSLLRVIWYPILLFVAGPAIVMLAVKLVFGI